MVKTAYKRQFGILGKPHVIFCEGLWHAYYRQAMSIAPSASDACRLVLGLIPTTPRWVNGRQQ